MMVQPRNDPTQPAGGAMGAARRAAGSLRLLGPLFFTIFIVLPVGAYFGGFILDPLEPLSRSFPSFQEAARLAGLLGRTVAIAAGAATLAGAMGMVIFVAAHPLGPRLRAWIGALSGLTLLVPGHFMAIAWIQTAGNAGWLTSALGGAEGWGRWLPAWLYSSPGCSAVMALHRFPVILGLLWMGWRMAGASALEAAVTLMSPGALWRRFVTGWLRPPLAVGWLIVFIVSLLDYSIPSLLRRHVFTVEIMSAFQVYYDPPRALSLALPLVAISLGSAAALGAFLSKMPWPAFTRRAARLPRLPLALEIFLGVWAGSILMKGLLVPLATFAVMAGGLGSYVQIVKSAFGQIAMSVGWSAAAAAAVVALAAALLPHRSARASHADRSGRGAGAFGLIPWLMLMLFALPGSVVGMAQMAFWNAGPLGEWTGRFYDSGLMLPLGLVSMHLPLAYLILGHALRQTPRVLDELEALAPGRGPGRWWLLDAPRLGSHAAMAGGLIFVLAMQEVHATVLLAAPGQETASVRAFTLLHYAPDRLVGAFCLTSLAALAAALAAFIFSMRLARSKIQSRVPYCAID